MAAKSLHFKAIPFARLVVEAGLKPITGTLLILPHRGTMVPPSKADRLERRTDIAKRRWCTRMVN